MANLATLFLGGAGFKISQVLLQWLGRHLQAYPIPMPAQKIWYYGHGAKGTTPFAPDGAFGSYWLDSNDVNLAEAARVTGSVYHGRVIQTSSNEGFGGEWWQQKTSLDAEHARWKKPEGSFLWEQLAIADLKQARNLSLLYVLSADSGSGRGALEHLLERQDNFWVKCYFSHRFRFGAD